MDQKTIKDAQHRAARMLVDAQIVLSEEERKNIEVCDYNLGNLDTIGTEIVIYLNTDRCCARNSYSFPDRPVLSIYTLSWESTPARRKPSAAGGVRFTYMFLVSR